MPKVTELSREALLLSVSDRIWLAEQLWESLYPQSGADSLSSEGPFLETLQLSDRELACGAVQAVEHADVMARARATLKGNEQRTKSDSFKENLARLAEMIATKDDFVAFAKKLRENLQQHPEDWENDTLDSFLEGLIGFAQDSEGYYNNLGVKSDPTRPSWRTFADPLLAARVYE
jgi:hypothetical protein